MAFTKRLCCLQENVLLPKILYFAFRNLREFKASRFEGTNFTQHMYNACEEEYLRYQT